MEEERQGEEQGEQEKQNPQRTRGNTKGCLIMLGVLLVLILLVGVCNTFCGTENSAPTAPLPTSTPRPTPTASCGTSSDLAYLSAMVDVMSGMAGATADIVELSNQVATDLLAVLDDTWRIRTSIALRTLLFYADEIEALTPSVSLRSIHADNLKISVNLREFVTYYGAGVDSIDSDLITKAGLSM